MQFKMKNVWKHIQVPWKETFKQNKTEKTGRQTNGFPCPASVKHMSVFVCFNVLVLSKYLGFFFDTIELFYLICLDFDNLC